MAKYIVMDDGEHVVATVTVHANVHVTAANATMARTLRALTRLPSLRLPVSDKLTNGDKVVRYDIVTVDDDRWPSALAYALGVGYHVVIAADDAAGAENGNDEGDEEHHEQAEVNETDGE